MLLFAALLIIVGLCRGVSAAEDIDDLLAFEVDSQKYVVQVHPGYDCKLALVKVRARNDSNSEVKLKLRIRFPNKLLDYGFFILKTEVPDTSSKSRNAFLDFGFDLIQSPTDVKDYSRNSTALEAQEFIDHLYFSPFKLDKNAGLPLQFSSIFYEFEMNGIGKKTYSQSVNLTEQLRLKPFGVASPIIIKKNQTFLSKVADLYEPSEITSNCEVLLTTTDPTKKRFLATLSAFIRNNSLMLSGKAPTDFGPGADSKPGSIDQTLQLEFFVKERKYGYHTTQLLVSLELRGAEEITVKEYFLVFAVVLLLCLFMCLVVLLASKSTNSQISAVAEEMKKPTENVMLSHSVMEWKKEDHPSKPLDQTVIDELYMFKEVDQKKNRKKRVFEEDVRPPELSLSQVDKKLTLEKTMSFAMHAGSEPNSALKPNPMNDTVDLSPIKRARGEAFKVQSPSLTPELANSYVYAGGLRSSVDTVSVGNFQVSQGSPDNKMMSGENHGDTNQGTPAKELRISAFSEAVSPISDKPQ